MLTTYSCAPSIVWVQDAEQILLVDQTTLQAWTMQGAEAIVWDLFALGYEPDRVVAMLTPLFDMPLQQALLFLYEKLEAWHTAGIVRREEAT